jgi:hypothetical protein
MLYQFLLPTKAAESAVGPRLVARDRVRRLQDDAKETERLCRDRALTLKLRLSVAYVISHFLLKYKAAYWIDAPATR